MLCAAQAGHSWFKAVSGALPSSRWAGGQVQLWRIQASGGCRVQVKLDIQGVRQLSEALSAFSWVEDRVEHPRFGLSVGPYWYAGGLGGQA